MRILIICHANTSRSIIAQALLEQRLEERALCGCVHVSSGGVAPFARDGALVSLDARLVLRDEGIDVPPESVATDLKANRHLVSEADLILAMTRAQIEMLRIAFPEATGKPVFTWKEFAGVAGDIEDPAGREPEVFAACRDEIKACVEQIIDRIRSAVDSRQ